MRPPQGAAPARRQLLATRLAMMRDAARQVTAIYRQRWTIKQLFRTMKTRGFDVDATQVEEGGPFENLATATLVAAVQVLQMVRERYGAAGRLMANAFDTADQPDMAALCTSLEGRTGRQRNPRPPGRLAWATWVCARLRGWNCYGAPPRPITVHSGLLRLLAMLQGWRLRDALAIIAHAQAWP